MTDLGWAEPFPAEQRGGWYFDAVARGALREDRTEPVDEFEASLWIDEAQETVRSSDEYPALVERLEAEAWKPRKISDLLLIAEERLELIDRYDSVVTTARHYPSTDAGRIALHRRRDHSGKRGTLTLDEWQAIKLAWRSSCAYCGWRRPRPVIEHVRPVCCGGKTELSNIVPSCGPCNRRKWSKSVEEWLGAVAAQRFTALHRRRVKLALRILRSQK